MPTAGVLQSPFSPGDPSHIEDEECGREDAYELLHNLTLLGSVVNRDGRDPELGFRVFGWTLRSRPGPVAQFPESPTVSYQPQRHSRGSEDNVKGTLFAHQRHV